MRLLLTIFRPDWHVRSPLLETAKSGRSFVSPLVERDISLCIKNTLKVTGGRSGDINFARPGAQSALKVERSPQPLSNCEVDLMYTVLMNILMYSFEQ